MSSEENAELAAIVNPIQNASERPTSDDLPPDGGKYHPGGVDQPRASNQSVEELRYIDEDGEVWDSREQYDRAMTMKAEKLRRKADREQAQADARAYEQSERANGREPGEVESSNSLQALCTPLPAAADGAQELEMFQQFKALVLHAKDVMEEYKGYVDKASLDRTLADLRAIMQRAKVRHAESRFGGMNVISGRVICRDLQQEIDVMQHVIERQKGSL